MKHIFSRLLYKWPQKLISLVIALVVWIVIDQSMTITQTYQGVNVRVINIPEKMSIPGISHSGIYRKVTLEITGKQALLRHLNSSDLEIIIDASRKKGVWVQAVLKDNLISKNPEIDIKKGIKKVESLPPYIQINMEKVATAMVSVRLAPPIGSAPKEFKFLNIYPKHTKIPISGPKKIIDNLKKRELRLRIDFNDIKHNEWESLFKQESDNSHNNKALIFSPPKELLKVNIPEIRSAPFYLHESEAKQIHLDFLKNDYHPIGYPIPVTLYFSPRFLHQKKQNSLSILGNVIQNFNGVPILKDQIYAYGVSNLFLDCIRNNIQCVVAIPHDTQYEKITWYISIGNLHTLEKRYVETSMHLAKHSQDDPEIIETKKSVHRNRFRYFLTTIKFYDKDHKQLDFEFKLEKDKVIINHPNAS